MIRSNGGVVPHGPGVSIDPIKAVRALSLNTPAGLDVMYSTPGDLKHQMNWYDLELREVKSLLSELLKDGPALLAGVRKIDEKRKREIKHCALYGDSTGAVLS